jgi:hypothetical protein
MGDAARSCGPVSEIPLPDIARLRAFNAAREAMIVQLQQMTLADRQARLEQVQRLIAEMMEV